MPKPYGSAPPLGAARPIADSIGGLVDKGKEFISHPIDSIKGMLGMPAEDHQQQHEQEIQKMNDGMNAHKNDAANASFLPRRAVPRMK